MGVDTRKEETILVVEDDDAAVRAIRQVLKERYTVVSAATAEEGRRALDRRHEGLVLDGRLAPGSGVDVLRLARLRYPEMPILAMTGHPNDRELRSAAQVAGAEYAIKPDVSVLAFARRVVIRKHVGADKLIRRTDAIASANELSLCETEVLALYVAATQVQKMPDVLGVSHATVKTYGQRVRVKCGNPLSVLAWHITSGTSIQLAKADEN